MSVSENLCFLRFLSELHNNSAHYIIIASLDGYPMNNFCRNNFSLSRFLRAIKWSDGLTAKNSQRKGGTPSDSLIAVN